jgi:asparagine synthase (glutamine-hydrolysing)
MCGIAGVVDLTDRPIDRDTVALMRDAMARRGPDSFGLTALRHAVLGHRRLAILDLSAKGNQPMQIDGGRLSVVFNGQIYNHLQLRDELTRQGSDYDSRSDTESLLHGYRAWGARLSERCRGMWAFAIWDAEERSLYLSRDRLGEKPLFYCRQGSRLAFASTLAGLRPALAQAEISPDAVASLLAYGYVPHTECIYEGVQKLPPAHHLVFDREGVKVEPYWHLDYRDKLDVDQTEAERLVEETLEGAVAEQLQADVPVGVFLSGGVDSGYVSALAARRSPGILSITMTVPGAPERDESRLARAVAERHGTTHIEVPLDQSCIRDLPGILSTSEPLGDSSIIPAAAVSHAARERLKVVLTGDGGDEGFDGYGAPRHAAAAAALRASSAGRLWKLLAPLLRHLSRQRIAPGIRLLRLRSSHVALMAGAGLEAWLAARDATPPGVRRLLYGPKLAPLLSRDVGGYLIEQLHQSRYDHWWEALLSVGIKGRLANDYLYKVDTATMYHSLESRAPFLDHRLIELATRLPLDRLLPDEHSKGLVKRLAAQHNPAEVVYAPKRGFAIAGHRYFRDGWGKLLTELVEDGVAAQMGLLDPRGVRSLLAAHGLRATTQLQPQLFSILALELWLRAFHVKDDSPEELGERLISRSGRPFPGVRPVAP